MWDEYADSSLEVTVVVFLQWETRLIPIYSKDEEP